MGRLTEKMDGHFVARSKRVDGLYAGVQACLDKLGELEDAEEQGLLLRLPCKVGDSVYCVGGEVFPFVVTDFCLNKYETLFTIRYSGNIELYRNWSIRASLSDIGKRIFFTKEEAEAALERMKGG